MEEPKRALRKTTEQLQLQLFQKDVHFCCIDHDQLTSAPHSQKKLFLMVLNGVQTAYCYLHSCIEDFKCEKKFNMQYQK